MPNIYRTNYKMKSQTKKILKLSGIIQKAVAVVNPMDYLRQQKISIHRLALEHADIYAYKTKTALPTGTSPFRIRYSPPLHLPETP